MSDESIPLIPPPVEEYERVALSKLEQYIKDGLGVVRKEDAYKKAGECADYIRGAQEPLRARALSKTHDNRLRLNAYQIASALTDVRPIWNYDTYREELKKQADIYSKLAKSWWTCRGNDKPLLSGILGAECGGSVYFLQQWNPDLPGGGDLELIAIDARDVVPIGPVYSDSIQDWQGVIVRQPVSAQDLINKFPTKRQQILSSTGSWFGNNDGGKRKPGGGVFSTAVSYLFREKDPVVSTQGTIDLYKVYFKDYSLNTSDQPKEMGEEGSRYIVKPGERLYPRGRCILAVQNGILHDFANHFWHGLFPLTRLTLLPLPETLLGLSVVADVIPLQKALNEWLRGTEDGVNQWIQRSMIADTNAISDTKLKAINTRASGQQIRVNSVAGRGFEVIPGPTFPSFWMDWGGFLRNEIDEAMGVKGLQAVLAQAKQIPSKDSLDAIQDSLSPLLKIMARSVETSLGEIAYQFRYNVDQFYTTRRRFQILGPDGISKEDYDFDPGNMIPSSEPGNSTMERALSYGKNFSFQVARNTMLNVAHSTQRLMNLQLFRANALDLWTTLQSMDLPNVGKPPVEDIIGRLIAARKLGLQPGPPPELVEAQQALAQAQAETALRALAMQAQGMQGGGGMPPPPGGAPPGPPGPPMPPPQGAPPTSGVGPQGGRPPSAQVAPHFEAKDGGQRTVVSESQ